MSISRIKRISLFVIAVIVTIGVAYILGVAAAGIVQKYRFEKIMAEKKQEILDKMGSNLAVGVTLPDADLEDLSGNRIRLSDAVRAKSVIAYISPDCAYCRMEMESILEITTDKWEQAGVIMISDIDPTELMYMRDSLNLHCQWLCDRDGIYKSQLGVFSYPFNFIVNQLMVIEEIIAGAPETSQLAEVIEFNRK